MNADGSDLTPLETFVMKARVGDIQTDHLFTVVDCLSVSVILGYDFLTRHGVVIDFNHCTFSCSIIQRFMKSSCLVPQTPAC